MIEIPDEFFDKKIDEDDIVDRVWDYSVGSWSELTEEGWEQTKDEKD